jgi:hypothetical protein
MKIKCSKLKCTLIFADMKLSLVYQGKNIDVRCLKRESESESELLYDWRFTANQFVSATNPLRLTTR